MLILQQPLLSYLQLSVFQAYDSLYTYYLIRKYHVSFTSQIPSFGTKNKYDCIQNARYHRLSRYHPPSTSRNGSPKNP